VAGFSPPASPITLACANVNATPHDHYTAKDSWSHTRPSAQLDVKPTLQLPAKVIQWKKQAASMATYREVRKFTFPHHYAGSSDLGKAVVEEATLRGLSAEHISRDLKHDGADLTAPEPYNADFQRMMEGDIDGYHAGFDCSTWTRARFTRGTTSPHQRHP
jgi:hypothetical protein